MMFGSLKITAIAVSVALVVGAASGWKVRDAFCDAAEAKRQVMELRKQIEAANKAAETDQRLAKEAADRANELETRTRDLEDQISAGVCLSGPDADRLRDLWR